MEYTLFLDTNALLNLGENAFKEQFVISQKTLEEIENIKCSSGKDGEIKYKARNIARLLDKNIEKYKVLPITKEIKNIINFANKKGFNIVYLDELLDERTCK